MTTKSTVSVRACMTALLLGACAPRAAAPEAGAPPRTAPSLDDARARVARIELCKTTEADLRSNLGPSMRDGRVGRFRVQSWLLGKEPERILVVLLDDRAVVVDISWDAPGALTWIPRDACAPGG